MSVRIPYRSDYDPATFTGDGRPVRPPYVRLVWSDSYAEKNFGVVGDASFDREVQASALCSYVYIKGFLQRRRRIRMRNWVLDSGAYSAFNAGAAISVQQYITAVQALARMGLPPVEIYALDVIGDWRTSLRNTEAMWRAGIEALPVWHIGEPEDVLRGLARDYPKIGIGGVATLMAATKSEWLGDVLQKIWPKKIHAFGVGTASVVLSLPIHSTDASSWCVTPSKFGSWKVFGSTQLRSRNLATNVRAEFEWFLALERKARSRWRREMDELDPPPAWVTEQEGT